MQIVLAILLGPVLWLAGAVFFDFVHYLLHVMLRSRWHLLRLLAWPHAMHHAWIDRNLDVQWAYQRRNIWCHIVPEYLTQLVFTAGVALVLPLPFAIVLATLQTVLFWLILREGGLDLNHRPIRMLDAYRPGPWTPPAYHALHHVYPDAYYSAYTKAVDALIRGAAQLRGRRFALLGGAGPFGDALAQELRRQGVDALTLAESSDTISLADTDVLVICPVPDDEVPLLEALIEATRTRKLPPEAWVVHARAGHPTARYYLDDVRLHYRTLVVPEPHHLSPQQARTAARRAVTRIRRGCHCVSTAGFPRSFADRHQLRATTPERPAAAPRLRHRREGAATATP